MESIYPELALCGSQNECARTDTVFFPISEVSEGTVSLTNLIPLIRASTRRYSPLRGLTYSSCGGLWPTAEAFLALRAKNGTFMLFLLLLGHFWGSVVTSVTFSSNLCN